LSLSLNPTIACFPADPPPVHRLLASSFSKVSFPIGYFCQSL
jgi:hypothetical protein